MSQSEDFEKAIGFAWWPTFKMVSFLEYLVFSRAVFRIELLEITLRIDFDTIFGILIFDPKWQFCKGYRLCMMADFRNGHISRILSVFSSVFLHRTTRNHLENGFWHVFWFLIFDIKWQFFKRYRLCMMADFQNCLIY